MVISYWWSLKNNNFSRIEIKVNRIFTLWLSDQQWIYACQPTYRFQEVSSVFIYLPLRKSGVDGGGGGGGSEGGPFDVRFGLAKVLQDRPAATDRSLPSRYLKQEYKCLTVC